MSWNLTRGRLSLRGRGSPSLHERVLILHNRRERFGVERCPPDQRAVNFFFGHQSAGVLWFNGAAIEDAELAGEILAEGFGSLGSDDGVGVGGHLRGCGFSGADGPDWFVGDHQADGFFRRDFVEGAETLAAKDVVGEAGFAFFEDFSDADYGDESGFNGGL